MISLTDPFVDGSEGQAEWTNEIQYKTCGHSAASVEWSISVDPRMLGCRKESGLSSQGTLRNTENVDNKNERLPGFPMYFLPPHPPCFRSSFSVVKSPSCTRYLLFERVGRSW